MIKFNLILLSLLFVACSNNINNKNTNLDNINLSYHNDKNVNSLIVPPDLTKPNNKGALILDKYTDRAGNTINLSNKKVAVNSIVTKTIIIDVKKAGEDRYLIVNKDINSLWNLVINFLTENNFKLEQADIKAGVLVTNYLENKVKVPKQSLGFMRSLFTRYLRANYSLPTIDRYSVRFEKLAANKTAIYLILSSMAEVITNKGGDDENTIWQHITKDKNIEIAMLYKLMLYLGDTKNNAAQKLLNNKNLIKTTNNKIVKNITKQNVNKSTNKIIKNIPLKRNIKKASVKLFTPIANYAKLIFSLNSKKTFNLIDKALDRLDIYVDKDIANSSFYLVTEAEDGLFTKINTHKFKIKVKQLKSNTTAVNFINLSALDKTVVISLSQQLFTDIKDLVNKL